MNPLAFGSVTSCRPGAGEETTVLVVDGSLIDRRVTGRILERHADWTTAFAADAANALALMERSLPRVVLANHQLPRLNGLALVEEVRARHPGLPVVLLTGNEN